MGALLDDLVRVVSVLRWSCIRVPLDIGRNQLKAMRFVSVISPSRTYMVGHEDWQRSNIGKHAHAIDGTHNGIDLSEDIYLDTVDFEKWNQQTVSPLKGLQTTVL